MATAINYFAFSFVLVYLSNHNAPGVASGRANPSAADVRAT